MNQSISISPDGTKYPLPGQEEYKKELARIGKLVGRARKRDRKLLWSWGWLCRLRHGGYHC